MELDPKVIEACGAIRTRDDAIVVVTAAVEAERSRCAAIVQAARFGEFDNDLRSIISMIECGKSLDGIREQINE